MTLWQMFLQSDAAYQSTAEMGELGIVEFRDVYTYRHTCLYLNYVEVGMISL